MFVFKVLKHETVLELTLWSGPHNALPSIQDGPIISSLPNAWSSHPNAWSYQIKEKRRSFPGESCMLCWFLKESETYSALTSQGIQNIHSTTEKSSEDVFSFIDPPAILGELAGVQCKTQTTRSKPRCLWKSMILTSSYAKTQLEMEPGSPFLFYNWSVDCIFWPLQPKYYRWHHTEHLDQSFEGTNDLSYMHIRKTAATVSFF